MMIEKMHLFYDEVGDLLEMRIGRAAGSYMKECGNGTFERIDKKTGKVRGFVIVNFRKRTGRAKSVDVVLPMKVGIQV